MNRTQCIYGTKIILMVIIHLFVSLLLTAAAAQVTLSWDVAYPEPDGYHLYQRQAGEKNFTKIWSGTDTTYTIDGLIEGITYYFVVRAYKGSVVSENSNEVEYTPKASTFYDDDDPASGNTSPNKPEPDQPVNGAARVGLTPTLTTGNFSDADGDTHAKTCYQISTDSNFSGLVFDKTSTQHLTEIIVPNLILEPDTTYYWRVKFFDDFDGASSWSETYEFTTIDFETAGDANGNSILDTQEITEDTDIDANGTVDSHQAGFLGVKTTDSENAFMAVKRIDENAYIGSVLYLGPELLPQASNRPEQLTDVISFKLFLLNDATSATVTIYLSKAAPTDALWYKYDLDGGWEAYSQAVFSNDRKSVTLTLEDGGIGDHDGIKNGIIVDPAGLGYASQTSPDSDEIGCFIASTFEKPGYIGCLAIALLMLTIICLRLKAAPNYPLKR